MWARTCAAGTSKWFSVLAVILHESVREEAYVRCFKRKYSTYSFFGAQAGDGLPTGSGRRVGRPMQCMH